MAGTDLFGAMLNPGTADQAAGLSDIQLRRQMLAALLAQSTANQPSQMMGQIAARPSPLAAVARMLTGGMAMRGLSGLSAQEQALAAAQAERAAGAGAELGGVVQGTQGTAGRVQEEAGPPDLQGQPSVSMHPGTPGRGPSPQEFNAAYERARASGVDPKVLAEMLSRNNRYNTLGMINDPSVQGMLPWNQGGGPQQFTPGNADRGASMSVPAGAPAGAAPAGGGMYGVPSSAAGFLMSGDPALEKLGATVAKYAEPQNLRAGGSLTKLDASGNPVIALTAPTLEKNTRINAQGQIEMIPGALPTTAAIQTQEENIKAGVRPVTMKMADGREVPGTMSAGGVFTPIGSAPAAAPQAAPSAAPQPASGPDMNVVNADMAKLGIKQAMVGGKLYTPQTAIGGGAPGGAVGFGQTTQAAAEQSDVGKNYAKQREQVDVDAANAAQARGRTSAMRDALQYIDPNAAAPMRQKLAEYAQASGLASSDQVKKIAGGDISAMQEFTKLAFGNSVENLRALVGPGQRISQLEMITNYKNSPNIAIQKAAINTMLDMQDGVAQWKEDKQQNQAKWVQEHSGTSAGFEPWWNRYHQLTGNDEQGKPYIPSLADVKARMEAASKVRQVAPTTGVGTAKVSGGIGATPANIQALLLKYGGQ